MELTIKEKEWYDNLRQHGLDEVSSNKWARFECLCSEFHRLYPEEEEFVGREPFEVFFNKHFWRFCIDSGRLTSGEIKAINKEIKAFFYRDWNQFTIDGLFGHHNPLKEAFLFLNSLFK